MARQLKPLEPGEEVAEDRLESAEQPALNRDTKKPRHAFTEAQTRLASTRLRMLLLKVEFGQMYLDDPAAAALLRFLRDGRPDHAPRLALNVSEAVKELGCSRGTVYGLIRSGELETVKVGRRRLVPMASIAALLVAH